MILPLSKPFGIELDGSVYNPFEAFALDACVFLFENASVVPAAFSGTVQDQPAAVAGITVQERTARLATITINPADIDSSYTRLVIAAHAEETEGPLRCSNGPNVNPRLRHVTYTIRALGFGHAAAFRHEDKVHGVALLTLERTDRGWQLDDDEAPTNYPDLVEYIRRYGVELAPFGA